MKKIAILGSTGKIGTKTLAVIRSYPQEFKVVGLSTNKNVRLLKKQAQEFNVPNLGVGEKDLEKIATIHEAEMVVVAVVGMAGLKPTLAAIRAGKDIALATKEVLVLAGEIVMREVKKYHVQLVPIDSEHSAIFQSLQAGEKKEVRRIILTMGKGPIAEMTKEELKKVTIGDVVRRSVWEMGTKIAVDSATCLNKSFEVIEAKWLFDLAPEQISIVVHPEYLCHSLVEFVDGSIITELGVPEMKRYIQYALFYPQRLKTKATPFLEIVGKKLSFEKPPFEKFPCLSLGFEALKSKGTMSAVMHGADKVAVEAFVKGKIGFMEIPKMIKEAMEAHQVTKNPTLDEIVRAERWGQEFAKKLVKEKKK